jgi:hypothetical protein
MNNSWRDLHLLASWGPAQMSPSLDILTAAFFATVSLSFEFQPFGQFKQSKELECLPEFHISNYPVEYAA